MIRETPCTISLAPFLLSHPARAQDASFGCKVLLCAAATTPSWSGIPYCVPVMQQLFTQLAKEGGWPTCAQGDASPVGYQPYEALPGGFGRHCRDASQRFGARRRYDDDLRHKPSGGMWRADARADGKLRRM